MADSIQQISSLRKYKFRILKTNNMSLFSEPCSVGTFSSYALLFTWKMRHIYFHLLFPFIIS